jgi:hypothetical protein
MSLAFGGTRIGLFHSLSSRLAAVLLTVFIFCFAIRGFAQSTTEGAIGGTVFDAHGAVVAGAAGPGS